MKYFLFLLFFIFISCSSPTPIPECDESKHQVLKSNVCICETGYTNCTTDKADENAKLECVDLKNDDKNCGVCGKSCFGSCEQGNCVFENGEVKESGDHYTFSCDSGFKLCRNDGEKFTCTNIENTLKKEDKSTKFKCFSLTDTQGCLDGNPCHLPDKSSEAYKAMTYDAFEQRIEDSLEITCNPNYDPAANANKGKDDSTCSYKCAEVTNKLEYSDCNGDLEKLKSASEGDGCEANLKDESLNLNACVGCKLGFCSIDNNWSNGCELNFVESEFHLNGCMNCRNHYCNMDDDWSNGCEVDLNEDDLHLNDCMNCMKDYCNMDGDWTNGCERMLNESDLHLNKCDECLFPYCNLDGDWSNGCEFQIKEDSHMADCNTCDSNYTNADGDWTNGCEVLEPGNSPSDCGDDHINCHEYLTEEDKKLYTATCNKDDPEPCGKVCNVREGKGKICGLSTCCPSTVECKGQECGCEIGDILENSCEDQEVKPGVFVGYLQACHAITGEYQDLACEHAANCNGNVCGKCHNGNTQCIQDEHGEYKIRQKCIDTKWKTGRDDCSDCRIFRCSFPNNNWWEE